MKGATAEPWVSTTRAPNTAITSRSGSSQYFLRAPMNSQSSCRNSIAAASKQMLHAVGRRSRRRTHDPVALTTPARIDAQRIFSAQAHDQRRRKHAEQENGPHHDRRHDMVQQNADPEP